MKEETASRELQAIYIPLRRGSCCPPAFGGNVT